MASNAALYWQDGRGWLVLAGATSDSETIRARVLGTASADGAVAVVATRGINAETEQILADVEDLGAQSGYLVDVVSEDDEATRQKLADAGVVIIGMDDSAANVRSVLMGAAIEGIQTAFENGAVVLAEGPAAMVLGTWIVADDGDIVTGLEWVQGAVIVPGVESVAESYAAREVMALQPAAIAVGIQAGSALALGPDGQVETWGEQQVTIALGPDFGA